MSPLPRPAWEAFALARTAGHSQSEAYRRAYPKSANWKDASRFRAAARLEGNPLIADRIAQLRTEAAKRNHLESDTVIQNLMHIVEADVCDFVSWKNGVVTVKDSERIAGEKTRTLASLEFSDSGAVKQIKLLNRITALQTLAKHFLSREQRDQIGTLIYNNIRQYPAPAPPATDKTKAHK